MSNFSSLKLTDVPSCVLLWRYFWIFPHWLDHSDFYSGGLSVPHVIHVLVFWVLEETLYMKLFIL